MPQKQRQLSFVMLTVLTLSLVLYILCFSRGQWVVQHYVTPMAALFLGMHVLGRQQKCRMDYRVGLFIPVWFVLSRMLGGELYLDQSFLPFSHLLYMYGMALPFAFLADDAQRRTGLKIVSFILFISMGLTAWVGVLAAALDRTFVLPFFQTELGIHPLQQRLMLGTTPNASAAQLLAALLLGGWLTFVLRKKWLYPIAAFLGLGLYLAIGLTVSRTTMLQVGFALAGVIVFVILRPAPKKPVRILAAAAAAVVCIAGVYMSFGVAVNAVTSLPAASAETEEERIAQRPLSEDLTSMNGRTDIYKGLLRLLSENPRVLAHGMHNSELIKSCVQYTNNKAQNGHNAYLQTILLLGLPGAAAAVWLTIRLLTAAVRVAFIRMCQSTAADIGLALIAVTLLINALTECFLFTEQQILYNFVFLLVLGYLLEAAEGR